MALGTAIIEDRYGVPRETMIYGNEDDVPADWASRQTTNSVSFTNPINFTTNPNDYSEPGSGDYMANGGGEYGMNTSTSCEVIPTSNRSGETIRSITMKPFRISFPGAGQLVDNHSFTTRGGPTPVNIHGGPTPDKPSDPTFSTWIVIVIIVAVIAMAVGSALMSKFGGGTEEVALAVTAGSETEWKDYIDCGHDDDPCAFVYKTNNGRVVYGALNQHGIDAGYPLAPTTVIEPEWTAEDIDNILGNTLSSNISEMVKYGVIGGVVILGLYVGVKAVSSYQSGKPIEIGAVDKIGSGLGSVANRIGAGA